MLMSINESCRVALTTTPPCGNHENASVLLTASTRMTDLLKQNLHDHIPNTFYDQSQELDELALRLLFSMLNVAAMQREQCHFCVIYWLNISFKQNTGLKSTEINKSFRW